MNFKRNKKGRRRGHATHADDQCNHWNCGARKRLDDKRRWRKERQYPIDLGEDRPPLFSHSDRDTPVGA